MSGGLVSVSEFPHKCSRHPRDKLIGLAYRGTCRSIWLDGILRFTVVYYDVHILGFCPTSTFWCLLAYLFVHLAFSLAAKAVIPIF